MGTLWHDLRYAVRALLKSPGSTIIAVLAIALGIGVNTAIFSVINAVLLRPLPYPQPERIMMVWSTDLRGGEKEGSVAPPDFADWQSQSRAFEQMAAYYYADFSLTGADKPERVAGALVTAGFWQVIGVEPALGRTFLPEEDRPGGRGSVVIISHGLWQRRFGSDPRLVGQKITLNGETFTVIGVMPPGFKFPSEAVDVWSPIALNYVRQAGQVNSFLSVVARLKPKVTLTEAQAEMSAIAQRLGQEYPENKYRGVQIVPLYEQAVGKIRPSLLVLWAAVGIVLLIACANVANLLLARAAVRRKEIAIRTALGASRLRLIRQLLTESMILALAGGICGLLLALWGTDLLVSLIPRNVPRAKEVGINWQALGFTLLISILTGLIFGLAPALHASKTDLNSSLKEGSRSATASLRSQRLRSLLVVVQIALSLMLLVGAGLFIKSFQRLRQLDAGFNPDHVLTVQLTLPKAKYGEGDQQAVFFQQALGRIAALPGVQAAGAVTNLPLGNSLTSSSFDIDGGPPRAPDERRQANSATISPDYFRALGIPVLKGRAFTERDTKDAPGVVIINQAMARRFFVGRNPIGRRLTIGGREEVALYGSPISREIVGVVGDVRFELEAGAEPEMYVPYFQRPQAEMVLVIRAEANPAGVTAAVRNAVQEVDKDQPIYGVKTMEQRLWEAVASRRLVMLLTGLFAGLALVLAAIGIYSVMSYSVAQRTHEIGIRVALGAQSHDVLKLVVGQGMLLALVGVSAGLGSALALTRVIASLLYGVSATDPTTFVGVSLLLAGVALLACYIPARRATKVEPVVALRYE